MPATHLIFRRARLPVPLRKSLLSFAQALGGGFCCLLTDDRELRRLNRVFLGKDYATDVLSFPVTGGGEFPLGELAVSVERAAAQARILGHSLETELRILMLHGVLHLKGLDHERDRGRMARAERRWRTRLGLPGGLIERAKHP